jgi:hypothetical protein
LQPGLRINRTYVALCRPFYHRNRGHGAKADASKKSLYNGGMKRESEITLQVFRRLPDPRIERTKLHSLEILMFIALCIYLSGGESFYDMGAFVCAREPWLKATVGMKSIPSHDTFNQIFQAVSPQCFWECLMELSRQLREKVSDEVVAFDGKMHRSTDDDKYSALHMLNAWSSENHLVLGPLAVNEKSNEITAVP